MQSDYPQLFQLDIAARLRLVEDLWDSIAAVPQELPVLEWQKEELERRQAAYQRNPSAAIPWEEALKQLRQGLSK